MLRARVGPDAQRKKNMQKITPFLWFNDNAEEAVEFYKSVFKKSRAARSPVTTKRAKKSLADRRVQS